MNPRYAFVSKKYSWWARIKIYLRHTLQAICTPPPTDYSEGKILIFGEPGYDEALVEISCHMSPTVFSRSVQDE